MLSKHFELPFSYKRRVATHSGCIYDLVFSPTGNFLATAGEDEKLFLLEINSKGIGRKEAIDTPHPNGILGLEYASEHSLYTAGSDGQVGWFDLERSMCRRAYRAGTCCTRVSSCNDYGLLAASTPQEILFYDENASFRPVYRVSATSPKAAFRPNSQEFAVCTADHTLQLFDIRSLSKPLRFSFEDQSPSLLKYALNRNNLPDNYISIDALEPVKNYSLGLQPAGVIDCVFSKDGSYLLVTEHRKGPKLYRTDRCSKKAVFVAPKMRNIVTFKSFRFGGPNDSFVLAGSDFKFAYYWPIKQNCSSEHFIQAKLKVHRPPVDYFCDRSAALSGFESVVNIAVMHPQLPLIFCGGVENALYIFSPFNLPPDDVIEPNYDSIAYTDTWLEEVYGQSIGQLS